MSAFICKESCKCCLHADRKPAVVMKKADPYHVASSRLWKSSVILGMAVATIV